MLTLVAVFLQLSAFSGNRVAKAALFPEVAATSAAEAAPSVVPAPAPVAPPVSDVLSRQAAVLNLNLPARDSRAAAMPLSPGDLYDSPHRLPRRKWLVLSLAEHSAAGFDAWSTRRDISSGLYQERNPLLRPFAANASIYVAIQAAPLAFDYLSRRMMASHHPLLRRAWWLPQALSTAVSLGSGAYNVAH